MAWLWVAAPVVVLAAAGWVGLLASRLERASRDLADEQRSVASRDLSGLAEGSARLGEDLDRLVAAAAPDHGEHPPDR